MKEKPRCSWVPLDDPLYVAYHDTEWGTPVYDDQTLFEFIVLESAQAGLSWKTILHRREGYRNAFKQFNPHKIARFTETDIKRLMSNSDIIRNKKKIEATIRNAQAFIQIQKEFGTFSSYMWSFVGNTPLEHSFSHHKDYPQYIDEAVKLSNDLKKRGFSFFGPTITYAHMQAVGMVNDHTTTCFRKKDRH